MRKPPDFSHPNAQPFFLAGGAHGVLLIHGFTGSPGHMRKLGDALNARGYAVRGVLLPGHGTRYEDMAAQNDETWLAFCEQALCDLQKHCAQVSVAGLSMGGVLTLLLAQRHALTAAVTISAPMYAKTRAIALASAFAPLKPTTMWREDPARATRLDPQYDYGYPGFPTKSAGDLNRLMRRARATLDQVTCPVLAVQSRGDETVRADSLDIILRGVSSQTKEGLWLARAPHVCTLSDELPVIVARMDAFLRAAQAGG